MNRPAYFKWKFNINAGITMIGLMLLFTSCFKKEKPITLPDATSAISTFSMGDAQDPYHKQVYFDLSTGNFQERELSAWDLCFESSDKGLAVFSNSGYKIKIKRSHYYHLNEPRSVDTFEINALLELPEGNIGKISASAIGQWDTFRLYDLPGGGFNSGIFYVELSYLKGIERFRRFQIINANNDFYQCTFTDLDTHKVTPVINIPKNKTQNFTFYTFKNGGSIVDNAEPPKEAWDILFTQYAEIIPAFSLTKPYILRGVLSSPNNVSVAIDLTSKFEDISDATISNYSFSSNWNTIGWDNWKIWNGTKYVVNPSITYIIKDMDDYYYKLRFLDYIDKKGVPGNPKFEYVRLK